MQAALVTGKETLELVEMPDPSPSSHHTVVDISYCGICGTDLHAYLSGEPYNPSICGHEWVGHVSAEATANHGYKEGDRVAIGVGTACGTCASCARGDAAHCEVVFAGAAGRDEHAAQHGGFASSIAFPTTRLYHVPHHLSDEEASILEPATVAVHAVRRTTVNLGDSVLVIGAGPIGLLVAQCAKLSGAGKMIVVEPESGRRELAASFGADLILDPGATAFPDQLASATQAGIDVVFECAGIATTVQQSVDWVRRGGRVSLVGVANGPETIIPALWLVKEIKLTTSLAYLREDFEIAKGLAADGSLNLSALHTSTVPLSEIQGAFAKLAREPSEVKILVDPRTTG